MNQQEIINIIDIFAPLGEVYQMTNKEAIEAIKSNYPPANYSILREALDKAIEALEQTEWILCSERLPGRHETVLLSIFDKNTENNIVETGSYDYIYKDFLIDAQMSDHRLCEGETVLAWMPLPEPYRGE